MVKKLPIPKDSLCNKAAYIPAREIINHFFEMGINEMFFCAGHEDDWVDKPGNYGKNCHESGGTSLAK